MKQTRRPGRPDRRLAPRPLPAHLASAIGFWLSSRAALPALRSGWRPSSATGRRLCALAAELDGLEAEAVTAALDREIARRAAVYLAGLEAYRRHPYRRSARRRRVLWRQGTTRLLDYGTGEPAPGVVVVPSLINRHYVLDLLPERSFLDHFAARGLRPLVVDWGAPGPLERGFDLSHYIAGRLDAAFAAAARVAGAPLAVLGYCMGGLLALALALRRHSQIACLALLATPWDFHAAEAGPVRFSGFAAEALSLLADSADSVPVEAIQTLFFVLDPFLAERKFIRFAELDPAGEEARSFVALEDWINDGVPLASGVARDCALSWYGDNEPARGLWRVDGVPVLPRRLRRPVLVVLPDRDRIVPPRSAAALAAELEDATMLRPALGHVGMMVATRAPALLWTPVAEWLRARLFRV
jgi:polyhydroxyalkanoate synthase subunit PhaC